VLAYNSSNNNENIVVKEEENKMNEIKALNQTNEQIKETVLLLEQKNLKIVAYSKEQRFEPYCYHYKYGGSGMYGPYAEQKIMPGISVINSLSFLVAPEKELISFSDLGNKAQDITEILQSKGITKFDNYKFIKKGFKGNQSYFTLPDLNIESVAVTHYVRDQLEQKGEEVFFNSKSISDLIFKGILEKNLNKEIHKVKSLPSMIEDSRGNMSENYDLHEKARNLIETTGYSFSEESRLNLNICFYPHSFFAEYHTKFHYVSNNIFEKVLKNFNDIKSFEDYAIKEMVASGKYTHKYCPAKVAYKKCQNLFEKEKIATEHSYKIPFQKK
jgi:hypothetical protein